MVRTTDPAIYQAVGIITLGFFLIIMGIILWIILIGHVPVEMPVSMSFTTEQIHQSAGPSLLAIHHTAGPPLILAPGRTDDAGINGRVYISSGTITREVLTPKWSKPIVMDNNASVIIYTSGQNIYMTGTDPPFPPADALMPPGEWVLRIVDNSTNDLLYEDTIIIPPLESEMLQNE